MGVGSDDSIKVGSMVSQSIQTMLDEGHRYTESLPCRSEAG